MTTRKEKLTMKVLVREIRIYSSIKINVRKYHFQIAEIKILK